MKGVIFNLLEEAVVSQFGDATWDDLLDAAEVEGAYTSLGSYPDSEIMALVAAASERLELSPAAILRWFGKSAIPSLATHYPDFFAVPGNVRNFLLSVNTIIHPEVRKLYSGAGCPHFQFEQRASGDLIIGYSSPRKLCALAEGFIDGAADHFGEAVSVTHRGCMHDGSAECSLVVQWAS
ncbi:MAG: heme NO-binding domain-containing protein [Sphingomonas sp.]|nr:heme NO-binding domain-containing protein [Sphingomonas sp.]